MILGKLGLVIWFKFSLVVGLLIFWLDKLFEIVVIVCLGWVRLCKINFIKGVNVLFSVLMIFLFFCNRSWFFVSFIIEVLLFYDILLNWLYIYDILIKKLCMVVFYYWILIVSVI